MAVYYKSNQALIHVSVTGVSLDKESWDMLEGSDPVADSNPAFPGGMADQVELGGLPKWSTGTVERLWSETLAAAYKELTGAAGSAPIEVSYVQLGANKAGTGTVFTYTGVLLGVERPKYKANESTEAYLKLTFGPNGKVG